MTDRMTLNVNIEIMVVNPEIELIKILKTENGVYVGKGCLAVVTRVGHKGGGGKREIGRLPTSISSLCQVQQVVEDNIPRALEALAGKGPSHQSDVL